MIYLKTFCQSQKLSGKLLPVFHPFFHLCLTPLLPLKAMTSWAILLLWNSHITCLYSCIYKYNRVKGCMIIPYPHISNSFRPFSSYYKPSSLILSICIYVLENSCAPPQICDTNLFKVLLSLLLAPNITVLFSVLFFLAKPHLHYRVSLILILFNIVLGLVVQFLLN